jgi:Uma2 family endonuclease
MSTASRVQRPTSLNEFLLLPEIDEKPYLEFIDGKVEAKVSPQKKHSLIATSLVRCIDDWAIPTSLGRAFVELRCTFAGRSIIPDVVFLLREHIVVDAEGEAVNETLIPPDLHVEIISPDQSPRKAREKLRHSTRNGCALGWLIHPERRTVEVYRAGRSVKRFDEEGVLDGGPVLPGFRLAVRELMSWTKPFSLPPQGS